MMIETIQNNQKNNVVKLPKNIRQVGPVDGDKRIYIEDYVMTYMKQIATRTHGNYQVAVLLGQVQTVEGESNVFISGAVEVQDIIFDNDKVFGNETWAKIYEDIKKYFDQAEIVGWYITRPGLMLEVNDYLYKIHVDNFAGNNKVLVMYDSIEREEAFYLFDDHHLCRQDGYYIYYEKNDAMQTYMIDHKDKESIEADFVDQTCINIRNVLERKNTEKIQRKRSLSVIYAAASVCAVFLIVVAVTMLSGKGVRDANLALETGKQVNNAPSVSAAPAKSPGTTEVNVQPGNIGGIKGEDVVGDFTPKDSTSGIGLTIEDTDPIPVPDDKTADNNVAGPGSDSDGKVADSQTPVNDEPDSTATDVIQDTKKPAAYTIKRGDTLGAISMKFYNSKSHIQDIMKLNKIDNPDTIYAGQEIKLP